MSRVVRRLVHEEHLGLLQDHPGERCTISPTAGQLTDWQLPVLGGEPKFGQHGVDVVLERPGAARSCASNSSAWRSTSRIQFMRRRGGGRKLR